MRTDRHHRTPDRGASPSCHDRARDRIRKRRLTFWRAFCGSLLVLVCVRAALPSVVRAWINHVLDKADNVRGTIEGVDLKLWRGAHQIRGLRLFEADDRTARPLLTVARIDVALQWAGLLRGRIVSEVTLHQPVADFVLADREPVQRTGAQTDWTARLDEFAPFEINRFVVRDGELRVRDVRTDPMVDAYITDFYLEALNVTNIRGEGATDDEDAARLPAEVEAAGRPFGTGEFEARLRFDPLTHPPRFELDASVRKLQLTDLNDFFAAYGSVEAEGGTLDVYSEFASSSGRVEGYVKTLFEDLQITHFEEWNSPADAARNLWEGLVAVAAEVLENQPHDRLAARTPVSGTWSEVTPDLVTAVGSILRNAFLVALGPAIDDSVELDDITRSHPTSSETQRRSG